MQRELALGVIVSAAIYLFGIILVSLCLHLFLPAFAAIECAGFCWVAYSVQLYGSPRWLCAASVILSALLGFAAGLLLIVLAVIV
jgi:hypothetical protein